MAKHVIAIGDNWGHTEDADCLCHPAVIIDPKDGEMVYLHEDYSKVKKKKKEQPKEETGPFIEEVNMLTELHNRMLNKAIDNPTAFDGLVIQHLNNGILTRIDYLSRKIALIEHGAY